MITIPEVRLSKLTRHDRDRDSVARFDDVNHREIGLRNSRLALHKGRSEQIRCKFDPTRYTMHYYHRIYVAGNRSGNPRNHVEVSHLLEFRMTFEPLTVVISLHRNASTLRVAPNAS